VIAGITFVYPDTNTIRAWKDGIFYNLQDAYALGLLTQEDIQSIHDRYSDSKPASPPVETMWEEKIYWKGSIEEDFDGNTVLLIMDKNVGAPNKVHEKSFFGDIEIESIKDLSALTGDINSKGINWAIWRQLLAIKLPGDNKENVVNVIRHLEKIEGIRSAEPNYFERPAIIGF
jgi:hypothetical protein